jgi:hypothetical protein
MWTRRLAPFVITLVGFAAPPPLAEYTADTAGPRENLPGSYFDDLRSSRSTHGELDHLPPYAILLHGDPETLRPAARRTTLTMSTRPGDRATGFSR